MINNTELISEMTIEALEHIESLESVLMKWEREPEESSAEDVNLAFRSIHSIKGGFSFFNFNNIKTLSHAIETILGEIRDGHRNATSSLNKVLIESLDVLRSMVSDPKESDKVAIEGTLSNLNVAAMAHDQPQLELSPVLQDNFSLSPKVIGRLLGRNMAAFRITVYSRADLYNKQWTILDLRRELSVLGEVLDIKIDFESITGLNDERLLTSGLAYSVYFASELQAEQLSEVLRIPQNQISSLLAKKENQTPPEDACVSKKTVSAATPIDKNSPLNEILRVRVENLDRMVALGSELVLSRNQLQMRFEELVSDGPMKYLLSKCIGIELKSVLDEINGEKYVFPEKLKQLFISKELSERLVRSMSFRLSDIPYLRSALKNIDTVTSEIQNVIMQIRMLPVSRLFDKFTRIVHDLGNQLGKPLRLVIKDANAELDKKVLDAIADPLTHLIRNAADHGIESQEERISSGKPQEATITLSARQTGGFISVYISDDGRGIDPEKIASAIIKKGLLTTEQVGSLSDQALLKYIMQPGFSTAKQVSDISGRGVGLDVVKTNIEGLGGNVVVETKVGCGTTFILTIPLTLAIIPALIIKCGDGSYAIPQSMIKEIVQLNDKGHRIESMQESYILYLRNQIVPVLDLNKHLGLSSEKDKKAVLIIQINENTFGLSVEELFDGVEIVVRPIHSHLKSIHAYSGATILGDGSICLILDLPNIAENAGIKFDNLNESNMKTNTDKKTESHNEQILLLRNTDNNLMGLFMSDILRLEKIPYKNIQTIGNKWLLQYRGEIVPLVNVIELLPERRIGDRRVEFKCKEELDIIIVNRETPVGLVVNEIYDAREVQIHRSRASRDGIAFCTLIDEKIVEFLDIQRLITLADAYKFQGM